MKKWFVLACALGLSASANADLVLVDAPTEAIAIGETVTITVRSTDDGAYTGWLEIATPAVGDFAADPELTEAGDPSGSSRVTYYPEFGEWYEFSVVSFPPNPTIEAGDHILVSVIGVSEGSFDLNLYGSDGETLVDHVTIMVVPEPVTIALLGLGGLFLRRRV